MMQSDSFPLKKMNGIWQANTIENKIYKAYDSYLPEFIVSSMLTLSMMFVPILTLFPNKKRQTMARKTYMPKVKDIPRNKTLAIFLLVLTLRELYIGNKLLAKLKATKMQHTLLMILYKSVSP